MDLTQSREPKVKITRSKIVKHEKDLMKGNLVLGFEDGGYM